VTVAGSEMETWVPVACGGPMGSVPPMTGVAVFSATKDQLRETGRARGRIARKINSGVTAEKQREAMRSTEASLGITLGARAQGLQPDGKTYVIFPQSEKAATRKKTEAWLAEQVSDADLAKYDFGKETKTDE
jgi:hypothetical protein